MKIAVGKKILTHGAVGALFGLLVLHPVSMVINDYFEKSYFRPWDTVRHCFSMHHLHMALYYTILGMVAGIIYGIYSQKLANLYEVVKELSITDDLTSLYNRRYLMKRLNEEIERAKRYSRPLSLLMIDIDLFKHYNDTHGHQQGDELLKALAGVFKSLIRNVDFVARFGGEEFVVVMPETDKNKGLQLAERLRTEVERRPFRHRETQPGGRVTISIGVTELSSGAEGTAEIIGKADSALYEAKRAGRNRTCLT